MTQKVCLAASIGSHFTLRNADGLSHCGKRDFFSRVSANLFIPRLTLATANYFERNLPFMDYPTYLARGYPIASGVIEGACRHLVKDRCELSGMRWSQCGAENLLRLRSVAENNDWDDYHTYRRQQCHLRLYGALPPNLQPAETQSLVFQPVSQLQVEQSTSSQHAAIYSTLPLAV